MPRPLANSTGYASAPRRRMFDDEMGTDEEETFAPLKERRPPITFGGTSAARPAVPSPVVPVIQPAGDPNSQMFSRDYNPAADTLGNVSPRTLGEVRGAGQARQQAFAPPTDYERTQGFQPPRPAVQMRAQSDASEAVRASQPQVGMDTTRQMEDRNAAFRNATSFDPNGQPVNQNVYNQVRAQNIARERAALPQPLMTPEQAQQEMVTDQLQGKRVQVDPRVVAAERQRMLAGQVRDAAGGPQVGTDAYGNPIMQRDAIRRMNINYSSDRLAQDDFRQQRAERENAIRFARRVAMSTRDPQLAQAAMEQANALSASAANRPASGFTGAVGQLQGESGERRKLDVAESAATRENPASAAARTKGEETRKTLDVTGKQKMELEKLRIDSKKAMEEAARTGSMTDQQKARFGAVAKKHAAAIDAAAGDETKINDAQEAFDTEFDAILKGIPAEKRTEGMNNWLNRASASAGAGATTTPAAGGKQVSREQAQQLVDQVARENPQWSPDQVKAEARKRAGM